MEFKDRLRSLRLKRQLTQKELGDSIGVSDVSVRYWEAGTKHPSMSAIISLAAILHVSTDYLLGIAARNNERSFLQKDELTLLSNYRVLDTHGKNAVDAICAIEKARVETERINASANRHAAARHRPNRYIPLYLNPSAAGYAAPLDGDDFEMILANDSVPGDADFAVRIQGNSMSPYIQDGDVVYVKKDCDLAVGDVGIFSVDGAMYCKQYYVDENRNLILISANPSLKNANVYVKAGSSVDVQCYGKVLLDYTIDLPGYLFE